MSTVQQNAEPLLTEAQAAAYLGLSAVLSGDLLQDFMPVWVPKANPDGSDPIVLDIFISKDSLADLHVRRVDRVLFLKR